MSAGDGTGRAVVIGAGFGGLAAAVRLRALGWDVCVVDALDQPGGRARVFRQDGYTFDAGPTVITAPHLIDELFTLVGRDPRDAYELLPVDPFYRVLFDEKQGGGAFDYVGDESRLLAQIEALSPRDVEGYRALAKKMERIFDVGFTGLADKPFDKLSDMLRIVPQMMKLESYKSVAGLVADHIHDDRLRQVFSFQPLLVGGNPFSTTSIYALIHWLERKWGVYFARGGTTSLVHALCALLHDLGVEVCTSAPVARIDVEGQRARAVVLESGERIPCELVVANADPSMVYGRMIDPRHRPHVTQRRLDRVRGSMSLFVAYFGTRRRYDDVRHHTIVLGPRYRELLDDIFRRKVLADDFSLYLHRPTATDPSLAPPGHDAFYVLSPVPHLVDDERSVDWGVTADAYRARIFEALEKRLMPGLRENLTTVLSIDPRTFLHDYRTRHGSAFGPEPVLTQSAWFRFHNRSPDIDGLYFVGAGTHPGAGVPGVLCSAKVLERVVPRPSRALPLPELQPTSAARAQASRPREAA